MLRWFFFTRKALTPLQKAERAATLAVPTQHVGLVHARNRRATTAGLLAKIDPETRARIKAKLAAAEAAR